MIGFGKRVEGYREVLDPRRRRLALLVRAALAAGLMIVLVIAVSLFEGDDSVAPAFTDAMTEPIARGTLPSTPFEPSILPSTEPPRAGESAPPWLAKGDSPLIDPTAVIAMPESEQVGEAAQHDAQAGEVPSAAAEVGENIAGAVRAPDSNEPLPATPEPSAELARPAPTAEASQTPAQAAEPNRLEPSSVASAPVTRTPRASAPARPAPRRFQVQLGGFLEPDRAMALQAELAALGHPALTQSRVTVGPYPAREEANRALTRLRSEQGQRGLIIQAPAGGGYAVQVGVFAEAGNAARLASRLATAGYPSQMQRRVLLGPYPDREAAEAVGAELGPARDLTITVLALP